MFILPEKSKIPILVTLLMITNIIVNMTWLVYKSRSFLLADVLYYVTNINNIDDMIYLMFYVLIFISMYVFPIMTSFILLSFIFKKKLKQLLLPLALITMVYLSYAISYVYASGMIIASAVTLVVCCIAPMTAGILTVMYKIKNKYVLMTVSLAAMVINSVMILILSRYFGYALYDLLAEVTMSVTFYGSYALIGYDLEIKKPF